MDTDLTFPAFYIDFSTFAELAEHCQEKIDSEFVQKFKLGDVLVA